MSHFVSYKLCVIEKRTCVNKLKFCIFEQFCCQNPFINHLVDAKDNLKFAELPVEEIVIKSDIAIKQEVLEPPDHNEDDSEFYDQNLEFYNQNAEWYEPEDFELTEKPIKKERGRPSKRQLEEGDYEDEWTLQGQSWRTGFF